MSLLASGKYTILPNTAGCYTADEAVRTCRLRPRARHLRPGEARGHRRPADALPRQRGDPRGREDPHQGGLHGAAFIASTTPSSAASSPTWAAPPSCRWRPPSASGLGIRNPYNLLHHPRADEGPAHRRRRRRHRQRRGLSPWSWAATGVLMNTAIAEAKDPILMAEAMRDARPRRPVRVPRRADAAQAVRERLVAGGRRARQVDIDLDVGAVPGRRQPNEAGSRRDHCGRVEPQQQWWRSRAGEARRPRDRAPAPPPRRTVTATPRAARGTLGERAGGTILGGPPFQLGGRELDQRLEEVGLRPALSGAVPQRLEGLVALPPVREVEEVDAAPVGRRARPRGGIEALADRLRETVRVATRIEARVRGASRDEAVTRERPRRPARPVRGGR